MTPYEQLEQLAEHQGIRINTLILTEDDALDGLYVALKDGASIILINAHRDTPRRTAALAEELGHHFRSVGDLRDLRDIVAAKSELQGHAWGFDHILPSPVLETALQNGNGTAWEVAEAVNLPADYVEEAAVYHQRRYRSRSKELPQKVREILERREARQAALEAAPATVPAPDPAPAPIPIKAPPLPRRPRTPPRPRPQRDPDPGIGLQGDYRALASERYGLAPDDKRWDAILMAILLTDARSTASARTKGYTFLFPPVRVSQGRIYRTHIVAVPNEYVQRALLGHAGRY